MSSNTAVDSNANPMDSAANMDPNTPLILDSSLWYFSPGILASLIVLLLLVIILFALVIYSLARNTTPAKKVNPAMSRQHSESQRIDSYTTAVTTVLFDTLIKNAGNSKPSDFVTYDNDTGLFTVHKPGFYNISFTTAVVDPVLGEPPLAAWVRVTPAGSTPSSDQPFAGYTAVTAHGATAVFQEPLSLDTTIVLADGDQFDIRSAVVNGALGNTPVSIGNAPTPYSGIPNVFTQMAVVLIAEESPIKSHDDHSHSHAMSVSPFRVDVHTNKFENNTQLANAELRTDDLQSYSDTNSNNNTIPALPKTQPKDVALLSSANDADGGASTTAKSISGSSGTSLYQKKINKSNKKGKRALATSPPQTSSNPSRASIDSTPSTNHASANTLLAPVSDDQKTPASVYEREAVRTYTKPFSSSSHTKKRIDV